MLRTIYGRLSAIMLGLFYAVGFLFIMGTLFSNHLYFEEATQRINRNVAKQFVSKQHLLVNGQVNRVALDRLSGDLMAINPTADIYLLDLNGHILYSSVRASSRPSPGCSRAAISSTSSYSRPWPASCWCRRWGCSFSTC